MEKLSDLKLYVEEMFQNFLKKKSEQKKDEFISLYLAYNEKEKTYVLQNGLGVSDPRYGLHTYDLFFLLHIFIRALNKSLRVTTNLQNHNYYAQYSSFLHDSTVEVGQLRILN